MGEKSDSAAIQFGDSAHSKIDEGASRSHHQTTAVDVHHDDWGVTGRLDVIKDKDGRLTVREYKATPIRRRTEVTPATRIQLALQVECLRFMGYAPVSTEVYFTTHNRTIPVQLDQRDRAAASKAVRETRRTILADTAPEPLEDSPQCGRCSHAGVCLPDERLLKSQARRIIVGDPDAQVVHLSTPGSRAFMRRGRMVVEKAGDCLGEVPLELIQGLQVHGNVDLSSALIRNLLWKDIPIVWCSGTGRLYGFAKSSYGPNGYHRVQQHVASYQGRLHLAREFVGAKIANQRTKMRRAGASAQLLQALRDARLRAERAETWQEVLGAEGEAASRYFANWPLLLTEAKRGEWYWRGRSGRPATDPINALLNYGYALLASDAVKALTSCGLDPHAGFLHSSRRNKPALALDLMEEFRAPIVDSVVQTVINNGEIRPSQFQAVVTVYRMDGAARKSLISAYERRMTTEIRHPLFGYSATWRRIMEVQARLILGFLDGTQPRYAGVRVR